MKSLHRAALMLSIAAAITGCARSVSDADGPDDLGVTNPTSGNLNPSGGAPVSTGFRPLFQAAFGVFPYPYDAYFAGSTDGTLNLPSSPFSPVTFLPPGRTTAEPAQNALDGFSTTTHWTVRFEGAINLASVTPASLVVLQVTTDTATKGVTGLVRPLARGIDYSVSLSTDSGANGSVLNITPLRPLAAKSSYIVLLTNGITSSSGASAAADTDYATIRAQVLGEFAARPPSAPPAPAACTPIASATLRALCQLTSTHLLVARAAGLDPSNIVLSFSFSTQSIGDTLALLSAAPLTGTDGAVSLQNTGLTTAQVLPGSPGLARIYAGTIRVPYYLTPPSAGNPTAPLNNYWLAAGPPAVPTLDPSSRLLTRFNPLPARVATLDIPVLLTVPTVGGPGPNGWPIVLFQHGTPRTRADALLVADSFAARGFAVIAIDLPLHGITPSDPFAALRQPGRERIFDLDLVNNSTGAPGPDGVIDETGTHFINLANLLVSRDNTRQAVADIVTTLKAIPNIDFNADGTRDFDPARIHLVGYSLGAIVGTTVLGVSPIPRASGLPMGAVGLTETLRLSDVYGPRINAGLAAASGGQLVPGSALYTSWFRDAQTVVDSADGINYTGTVTAGGRRIYVGFVIGGAPNPAGGVWGPDTTVPNARTEMLTSLLGLPVRGPTAGTAAVSAPGVQVRFNQGIHNGYLDPRPAPAMTLEMQTQIAEFVATDGTALTVTNPGVIAP
jgi:pimeloyl-ACP methyl ester carboxylesterase